MGKLNDIINEQRDRIAELEQENALLLVKTLPECNCEGLQERIAELKSDKEALDRENSSLANLVKNSVKRAEAAERDLKNAENRVDAWKEQVNEMRETQFRRFNNEECWIYQGDGEDYPESLICPVVISAEQLRAFLVAEKRLAEEPCTAERYDIEECCDQHGLSYSKIVKCDDGNYVELSDYEALQNRLAEVERELEDERMISMKRFVETGRADKFAIEQQIKALEEALHTVANQYDGADSTEWSNGANHVLRLFVKHTSRLRQQLNGGE